MLNNIKKYYHKSAIGRKLLTPFKMVYDFYWVNLRTEKTYLKHLYKMALGEKANLKKPKTIQEKILWLRLNYKDPILTLCSDKLRVREFIKDRVGEKYLIPQFFHTKNPEEIVGANLPDCPVIIKTNHGCGGHIVIKDKNIIDFKNIQKHFKRLLKQNIYYSSRQWQYKNIEPCIIIEKLLEGVKGEKVLDYKLHCYNGKVDRIEVYKYNASNSVRDIIFYSSEWKNLKISSRTIETKGNVPKPKNLSEMIKFAESISSNFKFVRVDLYNIDGSIYFGELTFTPSMGTQSYRPTKWNTILGNKLKLD